MRKALNALGHYEKVDNSLNPRSGSLPKSVAWSIGTSRPLQNSSMTTMNSADLPGTTQGHLRRLHVKISEIARKPREIIEGIL